MSRLVSDPRHTDRVGRGRRTPRRRGQLAVGAERLFGVVNARDPDRSSTSYTQVSFFGATGLELEFAPYSLPRLGIDYFVGRNVSLGIAGSVAAITDGSGDPLTVVCLHPRFGYGAGTRSRFVSS